MVWKVELELEASQYLKPGDSVAFEMKENNKVEIRKATPIDFEFAFALEGTLSEWSSRNDEEAYRDL